LRGVPGPRSGTCRPRRRNLPVPGRYHDGRRSTGYAESGGFSVRLESWSCVRLHCCARWYVRAPGLVPLAGAPSAPRHRLASACFAATTPPVLVRSLRSMRFLGSLGSFPCGPRHRAPHARLPRLPTELCRVGLPRASRPRASRPSAGCPRASRPSADCPRASRPSAGCPRASRPRAALSTKAWRRTGASLHPMYQCGQTSGRDEDRWTPAFPGRDPWTRRLRQAAGFPSRTSRSSGCRRSSARFLGSRRPCGRRVHGCRWYRRRSLLVPSALRVPQPRKPSSSICHHSTQTSEEGRSTSSGTALFKHVRRRPTLPRGPPRSTIGAEELNFRVRNGTGCFPFAITAETLLRCHRPRASSRGPGKPRNLAIATVSREPHSGRKHQME
jgi:hypothetical protein